MFYQRQLVLLKSSLTQNNTDKKLASLILVHTKKLTTQWEKQLEEFLEINESIKKAPNIGQFGGGKNNHWSGKKY